MVFGYKAAICSKCGLPFIEGDCRRLPTTCPNCTYQEIPMPDVKEPPKYSDTQLLDWLQEQLDKKKYTGKVIFRWSITGRGFRLHETSQPDAVSDVRRAIAEAMLREQKDESEKD